MEVNMIVPNGELLDDSYLRKLLYGPSNPYVEVEMVNSFLPSVKFNTVQAGQTIVMYKNIEGNIRFFIGFRNSQFLFTAEESDMNFVERNSTLVDVRDYL
jgi:hypothetical protein